MWLPLLQVLLAAALITSNLLRPLSYSSFTYPERQVCDALNAPVVLVRYYWLRFALREFPHLYAGWAGVIIENIMYIALVGLLWYLVSIEIGGQKEGKVSIIAEKTGMRTAFDLLLISFGIYLGIVSILELYRFVMWHGVFAIPYFVWAAVIVVFYTRDLWAYQRQKRRAINS
jgi:hypothetical protein